MKLKRCFIAFVVILATIITPVLSSAAVDDAATATKVTAAAVTANDISTKLAAIKVARPDGSSLYSYDSAYECMGFAMWVYNQLWGTTVRNEPNSRKHRNVNNLRVGDYVRYYYHSIIITDIRGDTVVYVDQNGGPKYNEVKWGRTTTKSELQKKLNVALPGEYLTPDGYGFIVNHNGNDVKTLTNSPYGEVRSYYPTTSGIAGDSVNTSLTAKINISITNKSNGQQYTGVSGLDANKPAEGTGNKGFSWTANWNTFPTGNYEIVVVALTGPTSNPAKAEIGRSTVQHKSPAERLQGHLDGYEMTINGWAYDTALPNTPINAELSIINAGGTTVASTKIAADKYRKDLETAGKGNGVHGFNWNFDWTALPDGKYKILAYAENSGATRYIGEFTDTKYSLTFDNNDGSGTRQILNKWEAHSLAVPIPTRDGFSFLGWATTADATATQYAPGSSITANNIGTFYALWEKSYAITYDADGGIGAPVSQKKIHGTDTTISSIVPVKEGCNFVHWTDGERNYNPSDTYSKDANLALKAVWEFKTYRIIFITDEGEWSGPVEVIRQHFIPYQIPNTEPTMSGKIFGGWRAVGGSEKEYFPSNTFEENTEVCLTAIWYDTERLVLGDINGDGVVGLDDAVLGMQIVIGLPLELPEGWYARGNVDGEVGFSANDVRLILEMCK